MFVVAVAVCSVVGSIYRGCKKVRIFTVTQGPLSVVTPGRAPGISTQVSAERGQCLDQRLGICLLATVALYVFVFVRCCGSKIQFSSALWTHHNLNLPRISKLICCEDNYIHSFLKILLSQSFEAIFLCSFIAQITLNNQARCR